METSRQEEQKEQGLSEEEQVNDDSEYLEEQTNNEADLGAMTDLQEEMFNPRGDDSLRANFQLPSEHALSVWKEVTEMTARIGSVIFQEQLKEVARCASIERQQTNKSSEESSGDRNSTTAVVDDSSEHQALSDNLPQLQAAPDNNDDQARANDQKKRSRPDETGHIDLVGAARSQTEPDKKSAKRVRTPFPTGASTPSAPPPQPTGSLSPLELSKTRLERIATTIWEIQRLQNQFRNQFQ